MWSKKMLISVFLLKNLLIVSLAMNICLVVKNMNGDEATASSSWMSQISKSQSLVSSTTSFIKADATEDLDGGYVDDGVVINLDQ